MQGRLLPKYQGRYQAHPVDYWENEFRIAADIGLDCIEFIFDYNEFQKNPLYTSQGLDRIKKITEETKVSVSSVCADYFMEAPLHSVDKHVADKSVAMMCNLIQKVATINVKDIVLPCVDQSTLGTEDDIQRFLMNIKPVIQEAEKVKVNISLETDLNPVEFGQLLNEIQSPYITVNYDTGNSASLGYDPVEEFAVYGQRISDIHIKDRLLHGGSVKLGTGNLDFKRFFSAFRSINFQGPLIMQVYRDDEGIAVFEEQLSFFRNQLNNN